MSSTNLLLGSTGFLLVVALFFSFTKMNQGKNQNPGEIAALTREIARLEAQQREFEKKAAQSPGNLIFTTQYDPNTSPVVVEDDDTTARMKALEEQVGLLVEKNDNLQREIESVNQPEPEPLLPSIVEEEEVVKTEEPEDPYLSRRKRLIKVAILQATVEEWAADNWTIAIDPTGLANFSVGEELALRRNDGILCTFTVTRKVGDKFIGDLKSRIGGVTPDVKPGDELIIPPGFDRGES